MARGLSLLTMRPSESHRRAQPGRHRRKSFTGGNVAFADERPFHHIDAGALQEIPPRRRSSGGLSLEEAESSQQKCPEHNGPINWRSRSRRNSERNAASVRLPRVPMPLLNRTTSQPADSEMWPCMRCRVSWRRAWGALRSGAGDCHGVFATGSTPGCTVLKSTGKASTWKLVRAAPQAVLVCLTPSQFQTHALPLIADRLHRRTTGPGRCIAVGAGARRLELVRAGSAP